MRGWPVATIAFYGPNLSQSTKVAVGIVPSETAEPREMRDWKVEHGDVRADPTIAQEILDFIESHSVLSVVMTDGIIGCPHQEGVDYEGEWCPVCEFWRKRDLSNKRYVYWWVDGIYLEARLEDQAQCILVIIGATPEGKKELVGFADGVRESAQSWRDLLLDLKRRGLSTAPQLAVADGALGFWKALGEIWPSTREQRCWVHKTANVLNKLPKSLHGKAKRALQDIWMAETKNDAVAALDAFAESYAPKYEKAVECLTKDRAPLLAFFDFPAEHWKHLRSTNPIESTFATVRHRTIRSKGCLSNKTALAMVFKLIEAAQKSWRCLDGHNQLPKLITGVKFADGIEVVARSAAPQAKAA